MIHGWFFALFLGAFGWQVHNVWIGLLIVVLYTGVVIFFNSRAMNSLVDSEDELEMEQFKKKFQRIKWIIFIIFLILISLSGAELISVS